MRPKSKGRFQPFCCPILFGECKVCGKDFLARSRHYELCSDECRKVQAVEAKLNAGKRRLNGEYVSLKNETAEVEKIRSNVYAIMREEQRREQPKRAHDMEL